MTSRAARVRTVLSTRLAGNRFVRFLAVGGLNTAFGYGVFALALFLGAHYAVAATLSTVLGVLFNFVTTGSLVFAGAAGARLHRFVAVYVVSWAVGILALKAARVLGVDLYLAGLVLILPSAGLTFLLLRALVFRGTTQSNRPEYHSLRGPRYGAVTRTSGRELSPVMAKQVENWGDRKWNENVKRARLAEAIPLSTPFAVFIEPTNLCNFKCTFCPTGHPTLLKKVERPAAMMEFAVFEETIRQLREFPERIRVLFLHKDGEPLLHPRIGDMMALAKSADFADMIWLTTNGSLLDQECAIRIIESGIDAVRVSIEHVDAEGYRRITKTYDKYDELRRNIEFLYNEKERRGSPLKIWAKMIDFNFSREALDKFGRDFGEIADEILLTQTGVWSNDYGVDFNLGVTPKAGYDGQMPLNHKRVACPYPFYNLAIQCNGTVSLCGLDWAHSLVGGELGAMRLPELWNSPAMNRIRLDHLEGNRRKYKSCNGCQCVKYMPEDNELDPDRERLAALLRRSLGL